MYTEPFQTSTKKRFALGYHCKNMSCEDKLKRCGLTLLHG